MSHYYTGLARTVGCERQLIIGLGTGRCGTVSLCSFLNSQAKTRVIHEGAIDGERHLFNWSGPASDVIAWLQDLRGRVDQPYFGDIGFYYLPYVEAIITKWPGTKFVVLKRDRTSTIASYIRKTKRRNHWVKHNGSEWLSDPKWDPTYPKFDEPNKEVAIGCYWDLYYRRMDELIALYPKSFSIHDMAALNSFEGRRAILGCLGYEAETMVLDGSFRENASRRRNQPDWARRTLWSRVIRRLDQRF